MVTFFGLMLMQVLKTFYLYSCLVFNHIRFWTLPTPEEFHYSKLGDIYLELGRFTKAIAMFNKSEESHNGSAVRYTRYNLYQLGGCFFELGDFKNAVHYFDKYLSMNPDDISVLRISGLCHNFLCEFDLTIMRYHHITELKPVFPDFLAYIVALYKTGRTDEASKYLKIADTRATNAIQGRILKAFSYKVDNNLALAIDELADVLSSSDYFRDHDSSDLSVGFLPVTLRGWQREAGDLKGALSTIESFADRYPGDSLITSILAFEYADQKVNLSKALQLIDGLLLVQSCNSFFLETKAWIFFRMGKIDDAKTLIKQSVDFNPNCAEIIQKYHAIHNA